jgi:hypothetical protein
MRVPRMPCGLRSKIGKFRIAQLISKTEDVSGRGPTAVNQNDCRPGGIERPSSHPHRLITMWVVYILAPLDGGVAAGLPRHIPP